MFSRCRAPAPTTRIAIAAQDPQIGRLLATALRLEAYEPQVLVDGEHVVDSLIREPHAVAIVEGHLAPVDGFTICAQVRATLSTPIILLLVRDDVVGQHRAREVGAGAVLFLPFEISELLDCVAALVRPPRPH